MTKPIAFISFLLGGFCASAQESIDTDRPDQTESAVLLPKKYFQGEFGFNKEKYGKENYTIAHPAFLLRYGLTKRVELRLGSAYTTEYAHLIPNTVTTTGLAPLEIGSKIALFEEKNWRPKTSFLFHLGSSLKGNIEGWDWNSSLRLAFQHSITEIIGLGYNIGMESDGEENVLLYTLSPNVNIGKKWYTYVELFGFRRTDLHPFLKRWQHAFDMGLAYSISNNTKLDFSVGYGFGANPMRNYIDFGFSFRIPVNKKYRLACN